MMKVILTMLYVAISAKALQSQSQDLQELYDNAIPNVVEISMKDADGQDLTLGSGFFIDEDRIVTNFHVIDFGWYSSCELSDGTEINVEGVVASDVAKDLAVLKLSRKVPGRGLRVANVLPKPGARVAVIGSPRGLSASLSDGIVSAIQEHDTHGAVIQMTAPISNGNSGGPVLSMDGTVIGVVSFSRIDGNSLNFAIPAMEIQRLTYTKPVPISIFNKVRNENPETAKFVGGGMTLFPMPNFKLPEGAADRVYPGDKKDLAEASKYTMILPNGDVIGLYRYYRTLELILIERQLPSVRRHLEALGDETGRTNFRRTDGSGISVSIEGLPEVVDYPPNAKTATRGIIADLPLIGHDLPIDFVLQVDGMLLCSINDYPLLIRNGPDAHVPKNGLFGDRIYFPVGTYNANGEVINVYDAYDPREHRPTFDELAYHAERGGAAITLYDYKMIHEKGRSSRTVGSGVTRSRVSKQKIDGVTYRWNWRVPDIRFIQEDQNDSDDLTRQSLTEQNQPKQDTSEITHVLHMKDGRTINGRLIRETPSQVVFVMVVGSIEHEMTFSKQEISELTESH
jgi:hypothetical protein